jgi:hypothetical protein
MKLDRRLDVRIEQDSNPAVCVRDDEPTFVSYNKPWMHVALVAGGGGGGEYHASMWCVCVFMNHVTACLYAAEADTWIYEYFVHVTALRCF